MPVYRVFRQDLRPDGSRMFWLIETEHEFMDHLCSDLNKGGIVVNLLRTERGEDAGTFVVVERSVMMLTLSACHNIDIPRYRFIEC